MVAPTAFTDARLAEIRRAFPVLDRCVYLNVGTYGPMPRPALDVLLAATEALEQDGVASVHDYAADAEAVRSALAQMLGAEAADIAFTRNATDGINLVLAGIDWQPGDEVITSDQEHEAVLHPLLYLQACDRLRVRRASCTPDADAMVAQLEDLWTDRTRLIVFSHVTCETGTRLPVEAMCAWARSRGVRSLVDGAQSIGAIPVDVGKTGCDYLTGNGHKWLHAPKGTGLLCARRTAMADLRPAHIGAGSLQRADAVTGAAEPWPTGARFEFGSRAYALSTGWRASMDWMIGVGHAAAMGHIAAMAALAKERLAEVPGVTVLTPSASCASAGLVAFSANSCRAEMMGPALRKAHGLHTRHVPHYDATRVSLAHFTSEADVDVLCRAVAGVLNGDVALRQGWGS